MVIVISGTPAAGKSSVSKALAKKFPKSAHIAVDELRHMVVGGFINPWVDKDLKQYNLIQENILDITKNFLREGYVVIIDDVQTDKHIESYKKIFDEVYGFLLLPSKDVLKQRDSMRDPEKKMHERIDALYPMFTESEPNELKVINSDNQTLEETVNEIFRAVTDRKKF